MGLNEHLTCMKSVSINLDSSASQIMLELLNSLHVACIVIGIQPPNLPPHKMQKQHFCMVTVVVWC